MGVVGVLDRFQRRHRWAGLPLAVLWKFLDDEGTYLAALITYYGFLSLFPLLLLPPPPKSRGRMLSAGPMRFLPTEMSGFRLIAALSSLTSCRASSSSSATISRRRLSSLRSLLCCC